MKYYLLFGLLTVYFIWTLRYAIKFNRTDAFFNKRQKLIHNVLIWLFPFIWIMILETISKPTPGTANNKKAKDKGNFYESEIGIWGDGPASNAG
ncbi:MAG: hypothetical protein K0M40_08155 [Prolixibacteraceae bacterium]|nr:hypothetical protein [Prolixibacteraceae bacterium]